MTDYPYAGRFPVQRRLPEVGRPRDELLAELTAMATEEDATWETGRCSGTMYCGDHDHYRFLAEAFERFAHVNALQRDMCPSATKFEGEIVAMALDLFHAEPGSVGLVTSGGTGSILHAVLAYRERSAERLGGRRPNLVVPETAHPAFAKACHLFGLEERRAPIDPVSTLVDLDWVADHVDSATVALVGSACNYGYGTIDPIAGLGAIAAEAGIGCHVDACLGGFLLPFAEELGHPVGAFDFRVPGVTSISADTHKYGYAVKGTSTVLFAERELRNAQYSYLTDWSGGKYCSPGMDGSRSGGLLAAAWASMVSLGRSGYRRYAGEILETAARMIEAVRSHPELEVMGGPTFLFSFTSSDFDVYHVNDFLRTRGWRLNGQQYPNALHMAVTRPQTRPGVVEAWAEDLDDAVSHAREHAGEASRSGAIYGGVAGGMTDEADAFVKAVMADLLDRQTALPPA